MRALAKEQKNQSSALIAKDQIKQLIFSGELLADSNYLETELADRLGMSRTPVRQATLMLEAQGLLEVQPRKGVRINSISIKDMEDIYEILTELECLAARRAAQADLKKTDLKLLLDAINAMETALASEDREAWAMADEAFHTELVRLGGNRRIESMVSNVNDQVRRARAFTLNMRPLPTKSNKDHKKLYTSILKGNAEAAHDTHRKHRKNASELLISLLKNAGMKRV